MPESAERLRCGPACSGRQLQAEMKKSEKGERLEEPRPPSPPLPLPPPPSPPFRDSLSPQTSGNECWTDVEGRRHPQLGPGLSQVHQHRPSVLRQGTQAGLLAAPRPQHEQGSSQPIPLCKAEAGHRRQSSPPRSGPSPRHTHHALPQRRAGPKQSSAVAGHHDSVGLQTPGSANALFVSGLCRWPGCDAAFEDFSSFLKHLHCEHTHGDKSLAQWRVQQDMVQYMESQLTLEKQKLFAMQLHLHLSEHKSTELRLSSDWSYSTALFLPRPRVADGDGAPRCATKDPEELAQHGYWPAGTAHLLPDLVPSIECYKYNNIRPPYTYACLIRWSILESADKQRTLNEIYNWFTTMFFYFRHNTATWKNAVRHNLSLHKCFVRVEGGKGAVWTVDEVEYQRRKGQKYYRDHPMKWLTPYASHFRPEAL